jgi:hypothetical protein
MTSINDTDTITSTNYLWRWRDLIYILLGIAGILLFGVIVYGVILGIRGINPEELMKPTVAQALGLAALETVALVGSIYLFALRRRGYSWNVLGLRHTSTSWLVITGVVTLIAIPITSLITLLVYFAIGQPLENPQLDFLLPEGISTIQALLMLFLAGFAAPFGEELFFRGVLYTMLRERWGIFLGVVVSSLLFGLIHGNLAVGITGFLLGVLAAIVFEYSNSLWTAILVHSINNAAKIGLLYLLVKLGFSVGS